MRIFLIGMMGAGKTTTGEQLAEELRVPFVDLDEFIEKREQKTIAQIFEQEGPDKFREKERAALEVVVHEFDEVVVATGGGTPCFYDNMAFINKYGRSVFLDVTEEEILNRLKATDRATRPLLAGKSDGGLREFITTTLKQRRHFYNQATYILDTHHHTLADMLTFLNHK